MKPLPHITTDRLILKPVTSDDLDIYKALLTSPETTRYLPGGKPFSEEYIASYLMDKAAHWSKGYGTFVVSLLEKPDIKIGYAGVETVTGSEFNDIRYALLPEHYGHGYALEAGRAALDFTFSATGLDEIFGVAVIENQPSVRLLNKLGMTASTARLYDSDDLITMSLRRDR